MGSGCCVDVCAYVCVVVVCVVGVGGRGGGSITVGDRQMGMEMSRQ